MGGECLLLLKLQLLLPMGGLNSGGAAPPSMGAKYYRTAGNETNAVLEFTGTKKMAQFRYRPASSELQLLRDMSFVEKTKQYPASHFAAKWPASSHPCLVYDV